MKIRKGQYGYRDQHKKSRALLTGLFAAAIIAQLIARQMASEQAAKNILTVMAGSTAQQTGLFMKKPMHMKRNVLCCMI